MSAQQPKIISDDAEKSMPSAEIDLVDVVLNACDGDPRLAIRELLADADFLRGELHIASTLMSAGMARGWKPSYERAREA